ncbi:trypsin-like serine protease [Hyalangium gracile]|uniref:trypsin-like serine protease n=1 Tax=Hyalangium gracile TaxID=394092 RepID=UPI001CC9090F|nr:trypsin-like serine protease [Hyalangium gracile]
MPATFQRPALHVWRCLEWVVVLLATACGANAPVSVARQRPPEYVPAEIQPDLGESIISRSQLDVSNRYLATVLVDGGRGTCSGVLIAPRVVLTAGHCVCAQHKANPDTLSTQTLIDKSTCARTASVRVLTYQAEGEPRNDDYTGVVAPHEQLRIVYNSANKELSSSADLALVVLGSSPRGVKPVRLATEQVRYAQPVTLVGFGRSQLEERLAQGRRFGSNEVATIAEDGATFMVGKPIQIRRPYKPKEVLMVREDASYSLAGDSGGPCLRERNGTLELVGIAKTHYGGQELVRFSEYTSTYFYLGWLRRQIANVEREGSD